MAKLGEIAPVCLRLREMKKDMFFGNIIRGGGEEKKLRYVDISNETPIVAQVSEN